MKRVTKPEPQWSQGILKESKSRTRYCILYISTMLFYRVFTLCLLSQVLATISAGHKLDQEFQSNQLTENDINNKDGQAAVLKVEVYVESQCSDTTKFFINQLSPVYTQLGPYLDLTLIPFGKADWTRLGGPREDYSFECQHGPKECLVNQLQCCGIDKLKTVDKYLPYISCTQATMPGSEEQVKCNTEAGLGNQEMEMCMGGTQGRLLHYQMGVKTKNLNPALTFVPWIVIDGVREEKAFKHLKVVLCQKLKEKFNLNLAECSDVENGSASVGQFGLGQNS